MKVHVRLFAVLREAAGAGELTLELPPGAAVSSIRGPLLERFPALRPWLGRIAFARNLAYCSIDAELHDGDELALIPPVSGG